MRRRRKAQGPLLHIYPEPPLPWGWSEAFLSADEENDVNLWGYHAGLNAPTAGIDHWDLPDGYATPRQIKEAMQEFHRQWARFHPWRPCWKFWNMP